MDETGCRLTVSDEAERRRKEEEERKKREEEEARKRAEEEEARKKAEEEARKKAEEEAKRKAEEEEAERKRREAEEVGSFSLILCLTLHEPAGKRTGGFCLKKAYQSHIKTSGSFLFACPLPCPSPVA